MRNLLLSLPVLALAACGDQQAADEHSAAEMMADKEVAESAAEQSDASKMMDSVKAEAEKVMADVADSIALDTSSMESFTSSLVAMKESLNADQVDDLTGALSDMAKDAMTDESSGGLMGAAKDMMSGKSTEDILYDKMKDKLDGLTFDDIMAMAKEHAG